MKVNVLGTEYEIISDATASEYPILESHADGFCDFSTKKILIAEMKPDDYSMKDLKFYEKKVVRHELVHAFLYESGLDVNSEWARNEEIVDWIALQFPKMNKAFEEMKVMCD